MSKITDYTDRSSCILFGDGAGAALVEASPDQNSFIAHDTGSDGSGAIHGYRTGLARRLNGVELSDTGCFVQNGREVYRWAVSTVPPNMKKLAEKAGMDLADVDWFVPHSANLRMIESICEKSGFPLEKTLHSVESCGNTSGASIPLSLDAGVRQGKVKNGETVLLYGFGAGLVYAGLIVRLFTGD